MKNTRKILLRMAAAGLMLATGIATGCYLLVSACDDRVFDDMARIPHNKVGLVLGCVRTTKGGSLNWFFIRRIQAAHDLFQAGKIDYILVSGDNHRKGYDEPTDMKDALIKSGVPPEKIVCDYAGFTTLDSIVRAREVFQLERFTVISQRFHNQRALFIARNFDIDAIAYNAQGVRGIMALKTTLREIAARVRAVLDVKVLRRRPHFLGDPIPIG